MDERSPLRVLDRSVTRGLGPGGIGVVMSRAGVGKTAFLVQVGLNNLAQSRPVLHISIGHSKGHVTAWYNAVISDRLHSSAHDNLHAQLRTNHIIQTFPLNTHLQAEHLEAVLAQHKNQIGFEPAVILIDDWDWDGDIPTRAAELNQLRATAKRTQSEIWMSARVHRVVPEIELRQIPQPCKPFKHLTDIVVFLEPYAGAHVRVRVIKDQSRHQQETVTTNLNIDPDTVSPLDLHAPPDLPTSAYTLLSGGAPGAETEFGVCAELWGLTEHNFSYPGRQPTRTRGIVELSEAELLQGEVSPTYVETQLKRSFPTTKTFQKTLQTIWHQVATAGEVFVIGLILPDNTVNGGTGWAAELGRRFHKEVHVFDQERQAWFTWKDEHWAPEVHPKITTIRFTGTGTRFLSEEGRQAIHNLFQHTFGPSSR
ncbi:MAG: hypothetical protein KTR25_05485 [Myxococcales bacterium]|nr:hypothetical protein [Myxococcales bacterium]